MNRDYEKLQVLLSENVRRLRHEQNLTQEQLALEADVDRTYVSQLERCVSNPSLQVLWRLAQVLRTDVATLLRNPKG